MINFELMVTIENCLLERYSEYKDTERFCRSKERFTDADKYFSKALVIIDVYSELFNLEWSDAADRIMDMTKVEYCHEY